MVTQDNNDNSVQVIYLTSNDTKPSNVSNGSVVVETDTALQFRYDGENDEWYPSGYAEVII